MITSGVYVLTFLSIFIGGTHTEEIKGSYADLGQCQTIADKRNLAIKTNTATTKSIYVCVYTSECDDCNKPVDLEKANKCERDCK